MHLKKYTFGLLFAILLSFTTLSFAQETTGNIEGVVSDQNDAVIPGATVKITGVNRGYNRTITTNEDGKFFVLQVPQGTYRVVTSNTGFKDRTTEVEVSLGQTSTLKVKLEAGGGTAVVDVTGDDVATIDSESHSIQTNINARRTELTPKGTVNFAGILRVSPAVRQEPLGAGFNIDGSSGAENTFIVDGLEVTNFRSGQLRGVQNIANDAVGEVQVKTSGFAAEFGGATGGVINVVSKGGDNDGFHGAVGTQFEVDQFFAATRPIIRGVSDRIEIITPDGAGGDFLTPPDTEFHNFFPSARIGGPIIKDRLWGFVSGAPQFRTFERRSVFADGSSETNRTEVRNDYYLGRLDGQIGDTLRLTGTYSFSPQTTRGNLLPFGASGSIGDISRLGGRVNVANVTYGGTWTPTSNLVVSARGGRAFLNEKGGSYGLGPGPSISCLGSQAVLDTVPNFGCVNGQIGTVLPNVFNTIRDVSIRNTFEVDTSYIANDFGGRHIFKGGYQQNRISNDVARQFVGGLFRFFFGQSQRGIGSNLGVATFTNFGTIGDTSSKSQSIYFQDSWQPVSRLTLNLGIRIEKEDVPSFSDTGVPIIFGWGDKPAPRLGFAYDVFGDGTTKVFGSWGWFYDRFKYELPRGSFGGDTFLRTYVPIVSTDLNSYTEASTTSDPAGLTLNFRVPSNNPADNRVDPDLLAARQSEITFGFERELSRDFVFRARYTHKQLDRTIEDVGFFDDIGNENFFIANPGLGLVSTPFATGVPATPKAERKYDAVEFTLDKRFADNYFFNATYTYSRLFGNYSGLASSDERGRSSPNVNRFFDLPFLGFDLNGNPNNGRLATDRPHAVKIFAAYTFDWMKSSTNSTDFTLAFLGTSGTPISSAISFFNALTFINERGDLGRTESFNQTDIGITHHYKFGSDNKFGVAFEANIINLFNQDAVTDRFNVLSTGSIGGTNQGFDLFSNCPGACDELNAIRAVFAGGIRDQVVNLLTNNVVVGQDINGNDVTDSLTSDARFDTPRTFQRGRQVRFGLRFTF